MHPKIEKIKTHVKKHDNFYFGVGVGLAIAGISCLILRTQSSSDLLRGQSAGATSLEDNPTIAGSLFSFGDHNLNTVNTIHYHHVKKLSYIVSQDGTNNWWRSQSEAARALGISESRVSQHLNHGDPLEEGISLTREGVVSAD